MFLYAKEYGIQTETAKEAAQAMDSYHIAFK